MKRSFLNTFLHPRFFPLYLLMGLYMGGCLVLRGLLLAQFTGTDLSVGALLKILGIGFEMDLKSAMVMMLPLAVWLTFLPNRVFHSRGHRIFFVTFLFVCTALQLFIFKADFEFFQEFNARFNTVAVDYLIYPHEVFINLWQSYPMGRIVAACIWGGFLIFTLVNSFHLPLWQTVPFRSRTYFLMTFLTIGFIVVPLVSIKATQFSNNRVLNEIASNGQYAFVYSAFTRHLDYPSFYRTIDRDEAYQRVRNLVHQPGASFNHEGNSIERTIAGNKHQKKSNVVILLIESFGSEFWGVLGREESLTPGMDALSKEGLLFTNLFATGNRTVRGIEGVLSSFPPLPGDSIVKRHLSDNVATLAKTLKAQGYSTTYLYGGRGVFDGMRSFALRNGFDRFIEQKDFPNPAFTTIWGVADEDLYHKAIDEFRVMNESKKPFFATVLSVSNHKPYTYPKGRIAENPDQHSRSHAVKYTDWALTDFFIRARKEKFFENTLFVVVADHGARVYGSQSIPMNSYKIPMLIIGHGLGTPRRVDVLGGSMDVAPTIMGFLGCSYKSLFFGRDLLSIDPASSWVVMHHNRDVGFYSNNRMVVLGLNKTMEFYRKKNDELEPVEPDNEDEALVKNAAAVFQVADELYSNQKYHL